MTSTHTASTTPARATARRHLAVAAAAGLATFALCLGMSNPEGGPAAETATGEQARTFLLETLTQRQVVSLSVGLGILALAVMAVAMRRLTLDARPASMLGDLVLVGALLVIADWWMFGAITALPTVVDDLANATPDTARTWYALSKIDESYGDIGTVARALFLGAASLAGLRARFLHRPVAWFGLVAGAGALLCAPGALWDSPVFSVFFFVGLFGFLLWLLAAGISLTIRAVRTARA